MSGEHLGATEQLDADHRATVAHDHTALTRQRAALLQLANGDRFVGAVALEHRFECGEARRGSFGVQAAQLVVDAVPHRTLVAEA